MKGTSQSSQIYQKGLEQLRISQLLLEEAIAKQQKRETIEALELREEALAYQSRGVALIGEALTAQRSSPKDEKGKSHARGSAL